MPNIKSARKRVLVNQKKSAENRSVISEVKTAVKKFHNAIDTNNIDEAERLLPLTVSVIDSAVQKGVLHKNNAANKKSALSKKLFNVKSGKLVISIKKDNKTVAAEKAKAAKEARDAVRAEYVKKAAERAAIKAEEDAAKGKKTKKAAEKAPAKAKKAEPKAEKEAKVEAAEKAPAKTTKAKKVASDEPAAEKAPAKKKTKKDEPEA